jgi:hypothetical protein
MFNKECAMQEVQMIYKFKAEDLHKGLYVVMGSFSYYVDDVSYTRDGEIKVSIGHSGTGTLWLDPHEIIHVSYTEI